MIVARPFAGLACETELIALREFVPSATAPLRLRSRVAGESGNAAAGDSAADDPGGGPGHPGHSASGSGNAAADHAAAADPSHRAASDPADSALRDSRDAADEMPPITLGSVLPGAAAALTRADGSILIGTQVQTHSGDLSRDIASAIEWALAAEPSSVLSTYERASVGNRLQDLLADAPLRVTVHDDFGWWLEEEPEPGSTLAATLERANDAVMPTAKVGDLPGAYWVDTGEKAHLRWVRGEDEPVLMAALARLSAAGRLDLGEGSRYVGSFRAHGCLVPVWDLDRDAHASEWEGPAARFAELLDAVLAIDEPLTSSERRARDGILGRQFTLR
jgi:hypothetical protein